MATVTRADLTQAMVDEVELSDREARALVDSVIETVAERLTAGETVTISGFGTFTVRDKSARMGRNPKTGEAAAISARHVVAFRASQVLKQRTAAAMQGAACGVPDSRDGPGGGQGG